MAIKGAVIADTCLVPALKAPAPVVLPDRKTLYGTAKATLAYTFASGRGKLYSTAKATPPHTFP